jgi:hypothetical protein
MAKKKEKVPEDENEEGEDEYETVEDESAEVEEEETEPEPEPEAQTPPTAAAKSEKPPVQKVGSIDSLVFLREYAKDPKRPYTAVASKLGIGPSSAFNYLQRYIALVEATASDPDFPRRARLVLNKNVPEKYHIPDEDIINLRPLTEVYGRHKNLNAQAYNQTNPAYSYDQNVSYGNPNDPFQRNPMGQPNPGMGPNNLPPGYQQKNQEYANLSTFSRNQMMRWVLEKAPFIHYSKIDPFIALFETDERNLMMNPDTLYRMMIQYFGKENGDIAFHRFKAVVGNFLPPTQGFGNNPWYPDPNAGGQMNQPSGVSYYEAVGAIPIGMNPNSQDAKRYIMEYEQKRREKMERKEQQEEFKEQIKNLMNMKMLEVVDPKSGGVGAKGPANMDHLVATGIVRAVQGIDEKGNPVLKYEPLANPLYAQMAQGQATNSSGNQIEWARLMIETFSTVMTKQSEMPKFAESLLNNFIQKMPMQKDPIEQIVNTKKVLDTIAPQTGASAMNLDVAKYNLAQERLKTDREFALMALLYTVRILLYLVRLYYLTIMTKRQILPSFGQRSEPWPGFGPGTFALPRQRSTRLSYQGAYDSVRVYIFTNSYYIDYSNNQPIIFCKLTNLLLFVFINLAISSFSSVLFYNV